MKTVDEMIAEWTHEERDQFKDLIKECRERESIIKEAREKSLKGIGIIYDGLLADLAELINTIMIEKGGKSDVGNA